MIKSMMPTVGFLFCVTEKREQNFLAGAEKRLYLSELIRKQAAPEKTVPLT